MTHDLQTVLMDKLRLLDEAVSSLHLLGTDAANKEKDYRVEYAKRLLILRSEAVPVSILEGVAKGEERVAKAKLDWDIAISRYDAAREFGLAIKKELDILNDTIKREWGSGG